MVGSRLEATPGVPNGLVADLLVLQSEQIVLLAGLDQGTPPVHPLVHGLRSGGMLEVRPSQASSTAKAAG